MTPAEARARADTCAQLAAHVLDPVQRGALEHMRQLWLGLAGENLPDDQDISAAFERLLAVQAELFRLPQMQRVGLE
jgi:hypothetical protein